MDVRQLEYFLAVVDRDGFTRAAAELYVSQSAISQAVRGLEAELGVQLFRRVGRRAVLTDVGRELIAPARRVVQACAAVRETAGEALGLSIGAVRVTTQESPGLDPLPAVLAGFHAAHPGVRVSVVAARRPEDVLAAVASGSSDLGLAAFPDGPVAAAVERHPLRPYEMVLISPPGAPVADDGERVGRERLRGLPLVLGQPGTQMRALADALDADGIAPRPVAEAELRGTLVALVLAGVGHAFVPEAWGKLARELGAELAYLDPPAELPLWAVVRAGARTHSVDALLQALVAGAGAAAR